MVLQKCNHGQPKKETIFSNLLRILFLSFYVSSKDSKLFFIFAKGEYFVYKTRAQHLYTRATHLHFAVQNCFAEGAQHGFDAKMYLMQKRLFARPTFCVQNVRKKLSKTVKALFFCIAKNTAQHLLLPFYLQNVRRRFCKSLPELSLSFY